MNRVFFCAEDHPLPPWIKAADKFVHRVLDILGLDNWELSVFFCSNRYIKKLNAQYRNEDEPTDVLSFPFGETIAGSKRSPDIIYTKQPAGLVYVAGDIVISLEALAENARFFKVTEDEELRRLLVHGILHLSGKDHATNDADETMLKIQEEVLSRLKRKTILNTPPLAEEKTP